MAKQYTTATIKGRHHQPTKLPEFYECGICGAHHPVNWNGDCRDDKARYDPDQLNRLYGVFGWIEVPMED